MNAATRERLWTVLESWFDDDRDGSIVMTWPDSRQPGGQSILTLGLPRTDVQYHDGIYLTRRSIAEAGEP